MRVMVDSFAWLELFSGGSRGARIREIMEKSPGELYTTAANYYEVYYRATQSAGPDKRDEGLAIIKSNAIVLPVGETVATGAAKIRLTHGLSAVDAFTLAAARMVGAKVLTGDSDFKKFPKEIIWV